MTGRVNFTLDADGTITAGAGGLTHDAGTGTPFYTHCNDLANGASSDYVYQTDNVNGTYTGWFSLSNALPTSFSSMSTLEISVDVLASGFAGDTCTLTARIYDADNDTTNALTAETASLGSEADSTRTQRTVSFASLTGTKAQWDSAHVRLSWAYTKAGSPDAADLRVYGVRINGTYTASAATAPTVVKTRIGPDGAVNATDTNYTLIGPQGAIVDSTVTLGVGGAGAIEFGKRMTRGVYRGAGRGII